MIRKIFCMSIFGLICLLAYSQERVLVTGFPEKNFKSDWKPIEKYAKKNGVNVSEVDNLFNKQLIDNLQTNEENFILIKNKGAELLNFNKYNYSTLRNNRNKKYIGFEKFVDSLEIKNLMDKYDAVYFVHFTQYHIYMTASISLSPKIVHRIDYQVFNKDLKVVSADKFKFSGISAGSLKPEKFAYKYQRLGNKLSKRLYIDLAKIEKEKQIAQEEIISDTITTSKKSKQYRPKHGLGFSVGWGAAYGYGIEYSYLISKHFDVNIGTGLSFSGIRTGLGTRFYFKKEGSSPFLGTNLIYATGVSSYNVTVNDASGTYRNFPDQAIFFRGGYKLEHYNMYHMITVGYGLPFEDKGAEHINGSSSSSVKSFANMLALGGIEISYTLILRLGK